MNLEELINELLEIASVRGGQVPVKSICIWSHPSNAAEIKDVKYIGPEFEPTTGHVVLRTEGK